jgi:UDP-2-acetamido-3-amino-2,3-dideoxy-glucuronate N-acetyltransferase
MAETSFYVHPSCFIDASVTIGEGSKIWHFCHIMEKAVIGKNSILGQNVFIGRNVRVGNRVKIQNNVSVFEGVEIEDDVFLGPSAVFTNVLNPRSTVSRSGQFIKTRVAKGSTIGANATIVCGNGIGDFAFVGAGSVVTRDVLPYALVLGNPAKQVGWVSEMGNRLTFGKDDYAFCEESKTKYKREGQKIIRVD